MTRLAFAMLALVIACALGVITSQHQARKKFIALESAQSDAKRLDEEFTQLQLEQGTWSTHKRVEAIAAKSLDMRLPTPASTRLITLPSAPAKAPGAPQ